MATTLKHPIHHISSDRAPIQKVCIGIGFVFVVAGVLGIMMPGFMGFHLSLAHNLIHLVSGALALWCGYAENAKRAFNFCLAFGAVYGLLAILGFVVGEPGYPSVGHMEADQYLLRIIPNVLEFGSSDHVLHLVIGGFLVFAAYNWRKQFRSHGARVVRVQSGTEEKK